VKNHHEQLLELVNLTAVATKLMNETEGQESHHKQISEVQNHHKQISELNYLTKITPKEEARKCK
jgi:hypothetical protein